MVIKTLGIVLKRLITPCFRSSLLGLTGFFPLLLLATVTFSSAAQEPPRETTADLTEMSLEALMNIEVTSVSRHLQRLGTAAAAIHVISRDDIRRSGVTNIADALKLAPGVQVARIDSNKWAVSIRGFAGRFANKLLVLMDGRSLYTPLFSGVFWNIQDTVLEDIDRIEVIRGPGAALWGSNAVNGVINIITRRATETTGGFVSLGAGSYEQGNGTLRYGLALDDNVALRMYAKHQERDNGLNADGHDAHDAWHTSRGGFRLDSTPTARDTLTVMGDVYAGHLDETYTYYQLPTLADPSYSRSVATDATLNGANLLTRWQRSLGRTDSLSLQLYYDYSLQELDILEERRDTVDLELQHHLVFGKRHNVVWGLGYRYSHDKTNSSSIVRFDPGSAGTHHYSGFMHDEITLAPELLALIVGARLEHNSFTGFEFQPNVRLLWTPSPRQTLWAAVSRAVRTPSRSDQDIHYRFLTVPPLTGQNPLPLPLRMELAGSSDFKSETLVAYELGYRAEPVSGVSIDVAGFYNVYDRLRHLREGAGYLEFQGGVPTNAVQSLVLSNDMEGRSLGFEVAATWAPLDWWRLNASYSYIDLKMRAKGDFVDDMNRGNAEGSTPRHQVSLRSGFDFSRNLSLDLWLRGIDRVKYIAGESIPGYLTMDARVAWRPMKNLELSLVGQNLLDKQHAEFVPEYIFTSPSEVERSVYAKVEWQF